MKNKRVYYSLYSKLLSEFALMQAFSKVKKADGSAGIDSQSTADFADDLVDQVRLLVRELKDKSYRPQPVLRVEIPKDDGGVRKLGIPAVRDRVVQQALLDILQDIFEEDFHPSSYGYRPQRSCHQAIAKAQLFMRKYEMKHVVDMDLSKCFDTLDHSLIIKCFRKRVSDGSILNLIEFFLKSGVMNKGEFEPSELGSPQGGVISPLIANVYLNEFDQEMMRRGHRIVRYADDILIFTRSQSAAENALAQASKILEEDLKLTVNKEKTHLAHSSTGIKFLGVKIFGWCTQIQQKKIKAFKGKVKLITKRNSPVNLQRVIDELRPKMRGFANYFRVANCKKLFEELMAWIRRRLRSKQMKLWKKPAKLQRVLRQRGYQGDFKAIKMISWRNACSQHAHYSMPNSLFDELKLFDMNKVETGISVPSW
ncbi:probable reverse transcriptase/maturase family protein [Lentisphaera araneosa HTCC2155]|uniref:Probable reverse transcriptase/maturase family protein n=2 Tax=Lentisphaera araneosa HTCC2155 TaxID=313628 RepID=A6DH92_9BACT|nr:group II intron reverse transcriptase/maturase [Lentisphaera araneosa]EDM28975.1 probable reverse transcriptase/maturase family protein [Lentisphaera araneosa HTCC2155]